MHSSVGSSPVECLQVSRGILSAHIALDCSTQTIPDPWKLWKKLASDDHDIQTLEDLHLVRSMANNHLTIKSDDKTCDLLYRTFSCIKRDEGIRFQIRQSTIMVRSMLCTKMHTSKMLAKLAHSGTFRSTVFSARSHTVAVQWDVWFSRNSDGPVTLSARLSTGFLPLWSCSVPWHRHQLSVATVTHQYCFLCCGWCWDTKYKS